MKISRNFPGGAAFSPGFDLSIGCMMTTILAFAILTATTALVLGSLRTVARDTYVALNGAANRMRHTGKPAATLCFAALWVMIFALSYFL
ncbi:hypothetical protein ATI53_1003130 [Salipiger aestuarii]|uniref:Uncharacterized protein n=2 Tax=Salipiger aestuarii TaxID=568098 RepID=A0A327YLM8_9RHOB|nr:hypothetical protein ATI53_1003130 [Salipiger aestuarii]